ncbi:hypothetical protein ACFE04_001767 [Oxalis oulophora]
MELDQQRMLNSHSLSLMIYADGYCVKASLRGVVEMGVGFVGGTSLPHEEIIKSDIKIYVSTFNNDDDFLFSENDDMDIVGYRHSEADVEDNGAWSFFFYF